MPKKKKIEEPVETEETPTLVEDEATAVFEAPELQIVEEPVKIMKKQSDIVKVRVVLGSVCFEGNSYEVGDVFETTRAKAEDIHRKFVEIID